MNFAGDAVTDLANKLSSDASALARVLQSDVLVDAPAMLHALAATALHLSTSAAEMAQAVDDVNGPSADELRAVQVAFAECSSTLLNIIEPVQRFATQSSSRSPSVAR